MFNFNSLPANKRHLRKVQLGAGSSNSPSHINVDFFDADSVDVVHDLTKPLPFDNNSIEEFYTHHVLEHFNYPDLTNLLKEILRCLKPRGRFVSRLPDFEWAARQFLSLPPGDKKNNMLICIYGGNAFGWKPADAHKHFFGWTTETLRTKLQEVGFLVESCQSVDSDSHIPVIDFVAIKGLSIKGETMWGERVVEVPWLLSKIIPGTVLDIGSAESSYVNEVLAKDVNKLTLSDIRNFSTHTEDSRVQCVVGDIRSQKPERLGRYTNVLCISTLEHMALNAYDQRREIPNNWSAFYPQKEAFAHMMKFVEKNGQMILTVPYGKYEDAGWVIVYDKGMITELKADYRVVEETYFTMIDRNDNIWTECKEHQCPRLGMDNHARGMRATSVACLVLKNK